MKGGFRLEIEISDKVVAKIMNNSKKLQKIVGIDMARKIIQRFNELRSAPNFKDYLDYQIGKPHPLTGNLDNCFGIHLNRNYRLVVKPLAEQLDNNSLKECKKIDIKGVVDYHDGKCEWLIP